MRTTLLACLLLAGTANAEQMQQFGPWQVHYIALPTTTLKPQIAARYGITRRADLGFVNISVLDASGTPVHATLDGGVLNLLSQRTALEFREVTEGPAIYYLATHYFTDEELLRFAVDVTTPDGRVHTLEFQQKLYQDK